MPKVYPTPPGKEQGQTEEKGAGIRKTFGVYDKPARVSSPAMIAVLVLAAIAVVVAVVLLMWR